MSWRVYNDSDNCRRRYIRIQTGNLLRVACAHPDNKEKNCLQEFCPLDVKDRRIIMNNEVKKLDNGDFEVKKCTDCTCGQDDFQKGLNSAVWKPCAKCSEDPCICAHPDAKSSYYDEGGISTLAIMKAKLTPEEYRGFLKGNIIKYTCRCNFKGTEVRDSEKISIYGKLLFDALGSNEAKEKQKIVDRILRRQAE